MLFDFKIKLNKVKILFCIISISVFLSFQKKNPLLTIKPKEGSFSFKDLQNYQKYSLDLIIEKADSLQKVYSERRSWDTCISILGTKILATVNLNKPLLTQQYVKEFEDFLNECPKNEIYKLDSLLREKDMRIAEYYTMIQENNKAICIYDTLATYILKRGFLYKDDDDNLQVCYYQIGYLKYDLGEIENGIHYFQKAAEEYLKDKTPDMNFGSVLFAKLAERYKLLGDTIRTEYYYNRSIELTKKLYKIKKAGLNYTVSNYQTFAKYYISLKQFDKALELLFISDNLNSKDNFLIIRNLNLKGDIYCQKKKFQIADSLYHTALDIALNNYGKIHPEVALIYLRLSKLYYKEKKKSIALQYCQRALAATYAKFENQSDFKAIPYMHLKNIADKIGFLEILDFRTDLFYEAALTQKEYLKSSYDNGLLAIALIDTIRTDYISDFDKQYLADVSFKIFEKNLHIIYSFYDKVQDKDTKSLYLNTAFEVMEKSKSYVLFNTLRGGQAERKLIPRDRLKLFYYRDKITMLDKDLYNLKLNNKNYDTTTQKKELELNETRYQYDTFKVGLHNRYPTFEQNATTFITRVQKLLLSQDAFVEYFTGDSALYRIYISQNAQECRFDKISISAKSLEKICLDLRESITPLSNSDNINKGLNTFTLLSSQLYNLLLKDIDNASIKRLFIAADGALHFIPFNLLLTEPSLAHDYSELPYLIKNKTINNVISGTVWQYQRSSLKRNRAQSVFGGFAPNYFEPSSTSNSNLNYIKPKFDNMPKAIAEVKQIATQFKCDTPYLNEQATERMFRDRAGLYRILHLSMHSEPNSENSNFSQLVFHQPSKDADYDNFLYLNELQTLQLNADIAVLSACETGIGKFKRGEGVINLAGAFIDAGVPTTVFSLWKLPTGSTQDIGVEFYTNLKKGYYTDEAMRQAKLKFLETNGELANPYYWAGLIPMGDVTSLDTESQPFTKKLIVFLVIILGILFWYFKTHVKPKIKN